MSDNDDTRDCTGCPEDAVGIVVKDGRPRQPRPRAVAFVWGGKVRPQPTLPYGRWKPAVLPAV